MLISFSAANYLSIKKQITLSMEAVQQKYKNKTELPSNFTSYSLIEKSEKKYDLLKSSIIYGLNASGKTNIMHALATFARFVLNSFERGKKKLPFIPFLLDTETLTEPSEFEIIFLIDGTYYRYGFSADQQIIHDEWLFYSIKGVERKLFTREKKENSSDYTYTGVAFTKVREQVRKNCLLLTYASLANDKRAQDILNFFEYIKPVTLNERVLPTEKNRAVVLEILKNIDIGLQDMRYRKPDADSIDAEINGLEFPEFFPESDVDEIKEKILSALLENEKIDFMYTNNINELVPFEEGMQSTGTRFFLSLLSVVLNNNGKNAVLLIDEIEESLHPILLSYFFKLFYAIADNIQLVSTTHNVFLLDDAIFRRDQIYIADKINNETSLVSLSDFNGVRKGSKYLKQYLEGRFGGIPVLSEVMLQSFVNMLHKEGE